MDPQMNVVEVSLRQAAVNLRLWLAKDSRYAKTPWRISMTLGWLPDSPAEQAWRATSANEQIALQENARKQTLQDSDLRGL
jgi:dTDP-D-glucose 4,6-dehydratase